MSEKRTLEICKLIKKENIDISWFCSTRVDRFTKKIADSISDAGCHAIFFGIESGDQETLNYFNKGFTLKKAEESINITKKAGINAMTFFILGTPIDNKERIKRTIHFSKKLKPKFAIFHQLTPFPGTKVYEMVEEENLLITKDWSKYCTLMSYPVIKIPGISQEELKNLLRKVNLNFYLKPSYIFTVFKEIVATNSLRIINDHIEAILKR